MKRAIFNFLVLQIVIWAFVFNSEDEAKSSLKHASVTDTWEVVKIGKGSSNGQVLHYPTFNKLTLNSDGSYVRLKDDETIENGFWVISENKTQLTLRSGELVKSYEIIQMPAENAESFIIKEQVKNNLLSGNIKYELTRI